MRNHHENGFEHLDLWVPDLHREYDLGIKFEDNTDGPIGYTGEPYLLLYVSFDVAVGACKRDGTFHYALRRELWQGKPGTTATTADDVDRAYLRHLTLARVPSDLKAVDRGDHPAWLTEEGRLHLPD